MSAKTTESRYESRIHLTPTGLLMEGHYTNLKYFDVTKTMYAEQKMLGEHGDNSGKWTQKQLEIIRREGLKEK